MGGEGRYDALIVGARCAGSTLAIQLARAGWRVLLLDKAPFGSDTLSTHFLFPNAIEKLERLGVLERLRAEHDVPSLMHRVRILGREVAGSFTPIQGHDRGIGPRLAVLDSWSRLRSPPAPRHASTRGW